MSSFRKALSAIDSLINPPPMDDKSQWAGFRRLLDGHFEQLRGEVNKFAQSGIDASVFEDIGTEPKKKGEDQLKPLPPPNASNSATRENQGSTSFDDEETIPGQDEESKIACARQEGFDDGYTQGWDDGYDQALLDNGLTTEQNEVEETATPGNVLSLNGLEPEKRKAIEEDDLMERETTLKPTPPKVPRLYGESDQKIMTSNIQLHGHGISVTTSGMVTVRDNRMVVTSSEFSEDDLLGFRFKWNDEKKRKSVEVRLGETVINMLPRKDVKLKNFDIFREGKECLEIIVPPKL